MRHDIDIGHYRARQITPKDFDRFDHVIALDRSNFEDLRQIVPSGARARLSMLLDHVPGMEGQDVADPYFGEGGGFEQTRSEAPTSELQSLMRTPYAVCCFKTKTHPTALPRCTRARRHRPPQQH